MDVGRLVQFIKTTKVIDEEDGTEPTTEEILLTVINKLERSSQGKLLLVAKIISREFAAIETTDQPALIAKTGDQSLLISHHQAELWTQKVLSISFPDKTTATISVAGLTNSTNNIQLLHLS